MIGKQIFFWDKIRLMIMIGIIGLTAVPLFGGGYRETPVIPAITTGTQYISPGTDGRQKAALDFAVTIYVKSDQGYVPEYGMQIIGTDGTVVKEVIEKEDRDIGWLASIFRGHSEFNLERSISWDGRDKDGNIVKDGIYEVKIWVEDAKGNRQEQRVDDFVVDTVKPYAEIIPPDPLLFAPNDSGRMDTLTIEHNNATTEDLWEAFFLDENENRVRNYSWENQPETVIWDGKDKQGNDVPEGIYTYKLTSTDRADNRADFYLEDIVLDRTETPIDIVIDPSIFSPNDSGYQDTATFYLDQAVQEGILNWFLEITNEKGEVVRRHAEEGAPPEEIVYDGLDADGNILSEGEYTLTYGLEYFNGNRPEAKETFIVDLTAPEVDIIVEHLIFSPNDDGRKDTTRFFVDAAETVDWKGHILDENENKIRSFSMTDGAIEWDGRDDDGNLAAQGDYYFEALVVDVAGNVTKPEKVKVKLDIEPVTISIQGPDAFSPADTGVLDIAEIEVESSQYYEVEEWVLNIIDDQDEVVRAIGGKTSLPENIEWDGRNDQGQKAPEGTYTVALTVKYMKGTLVEPDTITTILDVTPAEVRMEISAMEIYPYDPEKEQSTSIVYTTNKPGAWDVSIVDADGRDVVSFTVDAEEREFVWEGKDYEDQKVEAGIFNLYSSFTDEAGNVVHLDTKELAVNRLSMEISLDVPKGFSPNQSGIRDTLPIRLTATRHDYFSEWQVTIIDEEGNIVRTFDAEDFENNPNTNPAPQTLPELIEWKGLDAAGEAKNEGQYRVQLYAQFINEIVVEKERTFYLDITPPVITSKIVTDPFAFLTKDDKRIEGKVFIALNVEDNTEIENWIMRVKDKDGELLRVYTGDEDPSGRITYNSRELPEPITDDKKEVMLQLTVTDIGGNTTTYEDVIDPEVLIVKKDGKLHLSVPNIIFGAYQYELDSTTANLTRRNYNTLDEVTDIFDRYPWYDLLLEGHALNIYLGTPEENKEEEILYPLTQNRANRVKEALVERGMDGAKIITEAFGGMHPIVSTTDSSVWWQNRRVEFIMIPPESEDQVWIEIEERE